MKILEAKKVNNEDLFEDSKKIILEKPDIGFVDNKGEIIFQKGIYAFVKVFKKSITL